MVRTATSPSYASCLPDRDGSLSLPLGLLSFPPLHEDVVRDDVPGVVDADEEQEQRRRAHEEQGRLADGSRPRSADAASIA